MAFCGSYQGLSSDVSEFLKSAEEKFRKELKRIEQDIRPYVKQYILPAVGAIVGSVLLPGLGTQIGLTVSGATGALVGGSLVKTAQTEYEAHEALKDIESQTGEIYSLTQQTVATTEAIKESKAAEEQQAAQAGFFSKPSNLAMAALAIGLIAYVPPLKRGEKGGGRRKRSPRRR